MARLSVVVPVYRVERYLDKCVESILAQDLRDMEVILVDDGSPDGCPALCDAWAARDARVKVIHQQNAGSVMARRAGLLAASGAYVSFADGDDWLAGELYAPMLALAEEHRADVVISGYLQGDEARQAARGNAVESGVYRGEALAGLRARALFSGRYYEPGIVPALWNKLIRRELLVSLGDLVHPSVRMGDDAAVSYPLIRAAKCVVVDNDLRAYVYRETAGSLSRSPDGRYFERLHRLIEGLEKNLMDDAAMLDGLNYYVLFVLEVGFGQLIGAGGNPMATRSAIAEQIDRFGLRSRLAAIDDAAVGRRVMRRVRLLARGAAGRYMIARAFDMVRDKLGR